MANEYATLTELKTAMRIDVGDTGDDVELQSKLTAASRRVERDTGRRFWVDQSASARVYRAIHETLLSIDDASTAVGLIVEIGRGTSWTAVDSLGYDLLPQNAEADGKPIECIERVAFGCWPLWGPTRIRVTAKWGWASVPDEIKAATIVLAHRLFRRKDSPEGVAGFGDSGAVRVGRYDPDYDSLISPYRREVR